jgi:hypothetical protein
LAPAAKAPTVPLLNGETFLLPLHGLILLSKQGQQITKRSRNIFLFEEKKTLQGFSLSLLEDQFFSLSNWKESMREFWRFVRHFFTLVASLAYKVPQ